MPANPEKQRSSPGCATKHRLDERHGLVQGPAPDRTPRPSSGRSSCQAPMG